MREKENEMQTMTEWEKRERREDKTTDHLFAVKIQVETFALIQCNYILVNRAADRYAAFVKKTDSLSFVLTIVDSHTSFEGREWLQLLHYSSNIRAFGRFVQHLKMMSVL